MSVPRPNAPRLCRLFVTDLRLDAHIGIYPSEHGRSQPIRLSIEAAVAEADPPPAGAEDDIDRVVSYESFVVAAREIVADGHIALVETLAERLAARCLADPRVHQIRLRVEKLAAFPDAGAVGIEIVRPAGPWLLG